MDAKRVLVTAGNTQVPIDRVRSITNIFKGKTGTEIAIYLAWTGYQVTLVTSNIDLFRKKVTDLGTDISGNYLAAYMQTKIGEHLRLVQYRTYQELLEAMHYELTHNQYDIVIHSSAVSDYFVDGVCVVDKNGALIDLPKDGKVSSNHKCLYLRMLSTEKIIDLIRDPWGFTGTLVKFKLEVGKTDAQLMDIAVHSARHSKADFIVANCLEWAKDRAFIIRTPTSRLCDDCKDWCEDCRNFESGFTSVSRDDLPKELELQLR
jgi:phosphopantothenate-cysteine ligase/phosphopantothenoylcysteine decarboxylase/phosphopantothenate--cysteine ligase